MFDVTNIDRLSRKISNAVETSELVSYAEHFASDAAASGYVLAFLRLGLPPATSAENVVPVVVSNTLGDDEFEQYFKEQLGEFAVRSRREHCAYSPHMWNHQCLGWREARLLHQLKLARDKPDTYMVLAPVGVTGVGLIIVSDASELKSERDLLVFHSLGLKLVSKMLSLVPVDPHEILNRCERKILALSAEGMKRSEIAVILGLTEHTVNQYLKSTMSRLGAKNQVQLVLEATRRGLLNNI